MSVQLIAEPDMNNATPQEWRRFIEALQIYSGGFLLLALTNMDNDSPPQVMDGSRLEINGRKYRIYGSTSISGVPVTGVNYIYAIPDAGGGSAHFEYSASAPSFQLAKGGWYNGNSRAVASLYKTPDGKYSGKKIIDTTRFDLVDLFPNITPSPSGGTLLENLTGGTEKSITLHKGWYWVDLRSGQGGQGGQGGKGQDESGSEGGRGQQGQPGQSGSASSISSNSISVSSGLGPGGWGGAGGSPGGSGSDGHGEAGRPGEYGSQGTYSTVIKSLFVPYTENATLIAGSPGSGGAGGQNFGSSNNYGATGAAGTVTGYCKLYKIT